MTVGAPHEGARFAEHGGIRQLGAFVALAAETGGGVAVAQLLAYLRQEHDIRGIEDLAPSSVARGTFLRQLRLEESTGTTSGSLERELPILAVGGRAEGKGPWSRGVLNLIANTQLVKPHDLVVELRSSCPTVGFDDVVKGGLESDCEHMSYFTDGEVGKAHFRTVVDEIRDALDIDTKVCQRISVGRQDREDRLRKFNHELPPPIVFKKLEPN